MRDAAPVVFIPPQHGQSNHEVLATGHVTVNVIWGQSSERVECCPVCGKAKDGSDA